MIQIVTDTHKKRHFLIAIKDGGQEVSMLSIDNKANGYSQAFEWSKYLKDNCKWGLENIGSLGKTFAEFLLRQILKSGPLKNYSTASITKGNF